MSKGLLVTGTDTEIGKTRVSVAMLLALGGRGLKVAGMKPVASGCEMQDGKLRNDDAMQLLRHSTVELDYETVNPFSYEPPIAPHIAAARAGQEIDLATLEQTYATIAAKAEFTIVEGIGGWRVPLTARGQDISELALRLKLPVALVVGIKLGCISHAILTAEAIRRDGCNLTGWIANTMDPSYDTMQETLQAISSATGMEPTAVVPHTQQPQPLQTTAELTALF